MAKKPAKTTQPTADDLKAPLLAAVGAADLALERVNESSRPCASVPAKPAPTPRHASGRPARASPSCRKSCLPSSATCVSG